MSHTQVSRRTKARREAEKVFLRCRKAFPMGRVVKVTYPRRFPRGECAIAASVPLAGQNLHTMNRIARVHQNRRYPPHIINNGKSHMVFMWRFRGIRSGEESRVLEYANMLGRWAEDLFKLQAIVSPSPSLRDIRLKLRAPA